MLKVNATTLPLVTSVFILSLSAEEEPLIVYGKAGNLIGEVGSASTGQANNEELSKRPTLRRGELLEVVPGVIITQHSGGGKANQYFVRGYNLDHGTDFHVGVDGMPGNYKTHTHGQGYADLNFIVPEFVERLDYFKGPFTTNHGDLSTAGGANYTLVPYLDEGIASITYGENDFFRAVIADSFEAGIGTLTLGGEYTHEDGPWTRPNNFNRYNGFAKWFAGDEENFFSITGLWYDGVWDSTDQIPERAVNSGQIGRFDAIDDTTGGDSERQTLSARFQKTGENWVVRSDVWLGRYALNLFSNFTYFLDDPVNGDQFQQEEERIFLGANVAADYFHDLFGKESKSTFGFQTQHDWIDDTGLFDTRRRQRLSTTNLDDVYQASYGFYFQNETRVNDWLRVHLGTRADIAYFDVESQDNDADTGDDLDAIISPKVTLIFDPFENTEFYVNYGLGYHSNDARGVTASVDPVDPLVRTQGAELGVRTAAIENVTATAALWWIQSDSEFIYVGDEGTTEPGPETERYGIELSAYWRPFSFLAVDAEYSWSEARAIVPAGEFDDIDNSVPHTASAGITLGGGLGWFGSLRARYFSPRPLLGDFSQSESQESLQVNARVGYNWENLSLSLDVLNLFDRDDRDIEYFYESQLPGEASPIEDIHFHPAEPRQVRVNLTYHW